MVSSDSEKETERRRPLLEYLQQALADAGFRYEILFHQTALSEPDAFCFFEKEIVQGVILRANDRFVMVVLPIHSEIDLENVKKTLQADLLQPAASSEVRSLFPETFPKRTPSPAGLRHLAVYVDLSLLESEKIAFSTGKGNPLIRMRTVDFMKLVSPSLGNFQLRRTPFPR